MRHGLIRWDEDELSARDVSGRQTRLRDAMAREGLDGMVIYTNHVRSGALTWATGFTPYWSDALWFLPREGPPVLSTALSKRVGKWIAATNPTTGITHSPSPGGAIGKIMSEQRAGHVGVVELDRMPQALVAQIHSEHSVDLVDASGLFARVRSLSDSAERRLVSSADALARRAFEAIPDAPIQVGDVSGAIELAARLGGAEEVYVATAPDLHNDQRFARHKGAVPLASRHAARVSLARHGVWIRRIETFDARNGGEIERLGDWADRVCGGLTAAPGMAAAIDAAALPDGVSLRHWRLEAPVAGRPLQTVAESGEEVSESHAYGVLTMTFDLAGGPAVLARPIGGN